MSTPPKWAQDLLIEACLFLGIDYLPTLIWQHRRDNYSSGVCNGKGGEAQLTIRAGRDHKDAKLVLLHEISHVVTDSKKTYHTYNDCIGPDGNRISVTAISRSVCHTDAFWDTAWRLYRWAKIPVRYTLQREGEYKAGAVLAYRRSRKGE